MKKVNPPVRTKEELAAQFGIGLMQLNNIMKNDPTAPQPALDRGGQVSGGFHPAHRKRRKNYYVLSEMVTWWAEKQKSLSK